MVILVRRDVASSLLQSETGARKTMTEPTDMLTLVSHVATENLVFPAILSETDAKLCPPNTTNRLRELISAGNFRRHTNTTKSQVACAGNSHLARQATVNSTKTRTA